jgi:Uma2 family endonuclease
MAPIPPADPPRPPPISPELWASIGHVPAGRIFIEPAPGEATEADVIAARHLPERWICELIDGVLIMKAPGFYQACLSPILSTHILNHLEGNNRGIVVGASAMMRLRPGLVRCVDVAFHSWENLPGRKIPREPIPSVAPDLAVDILRDGNTPAEMSRKASEYFEAGSKQVWHLDTTDRSVRVSSSSGGMTRLDESQTLDGGDVLPGFRLAIREWFARAEDPLGWA